MVNKVDFSKANIIEADYVRYMNNVNIFHATEHYGKLKIFITTLMHCKLS